MEHFSSKRLAAAEQWREQLHGAMDHRAIREGVLQLVVEVAALSDIVTNATSVACVIAADLAVFDADLDYDLVDGGPGAEQPPHSHVVKQDQSDD